MKGVKTGIPQGSPVSPILYLFFNAPLLEECAKLKLPIQIGGFVDDVHLIAYGKSTEANCEALRITHNVCLNWAKTHGATFAPHKYELIHLTRSPKRFNMKAMVDLSKVKVKPDAVIRVLGLHIDGKLRWGPHIQKIKAKMTTQQLALSVVTGSTWSANLNKARQVYIAVVRPAMIYAASIWHSPKGLTEARQAREKTLGTIQNGCLRTILGAFQATNTKVLEAEADIPPMQLHLNQLVLRAEALREGHEPIRRDTARIRRRLKGCRGRTRPTGETPTEAKDKWALSTLNKDHWERGTRHKNEIKKWIKSQWTED